MKIADALNKRYLATIIKSKSNKSWYVNKIGETFEVIANKKMMVWAVADDLTEGDIADRLIEPEDCNISYLREDLEFYKSEKIVIVKNFPGLDAEMTRYDLRKMAKELNAAADMLEKHNSDL